MSGPTGFEAVEVLVAGAGEWLDSTVGVLVVELAPGQAERAAALARAAGFGDVRVERDLTGRERALVARVPEAAAS